MNQPSPELNLLKRQFSVAPMLDWTDRHCRYFLRLISKEALLYTEMVTTGAIIHGKGDFLGFNREEHSVALQLGGSDPAEMAECAVRAQEKGYDEVNINVGCPSDRVQNGRFGACLMAEPNVVAQCVKSMQDKVSIPVTVKCRIGIDDMDDYKDLTQFIKTVSDGGCDTFIVHARKAWLQGLSPKENREIPPLMYDRVYHLKEEFPDLHISINGGVKTLDEVADHLASVDGVMVGREVYSNPYMMSGVDARFYGAETTPMTREEVVHKMVPYIDAYVEQGGRAWHVIRHMLGIFQGQPAGKVFRRFLSQNAIKKETTSAVLMQALEEVATTRARVEEFEQSRLNRAEN